MQQDTDKRKILLGLGWTSIATIVVGLTQVLRLSFLARFISKEDFGIVAILTFILGLTQVFSDMGFSAPVMGERKLTHSQFLNLYWIQLFVFVIFFIVISLLSPFIAKYYNIPSLSYLIPITLTEILFISIGKLYDTVLQKQLLFRTISIRNIISSIISLAIAITIAYMDGGVYSLVLSTLSYTAIVNLWNFIMGQKEYKLHFHKIDLKETYSLISIGLYQMGTQILDYLSSKLDILFVSIFFDVSILGVYNLAKELVLKFVVIVNSITSKVMLPIFSKYQAQQELLKQTFASFISKMAILNTSIVGFVFLFSTFVTSVFYGEEYADTSALVKIMSIWSLFVILVQPNGLIAIAMKETSKTFYYTIVRLCIIVLMLLAFARYSINAAAYTMLASYIIMMFVNWKMLLHETISLNLRDYVSQFKGSTGSIIIIITIFILLHIFHSDSIVIDTFIYSPIYIAASFLYIYVKFTKKTNNYANQQ